MMQDTKGTQDNIDRFDELALKLGIVGPGSLAHFTQTRYHLLIHVEPFQGWHAQLRNEPALDLFYQRKWRFHDESAGGWGWDAIPQWDMRVGNVYDYLGAGGLLRFGRNLRADYRPISSPGSPCSTAIPGSPIPMSTVPGNSPISRARPLRRAQPHHPSGILNEPMSKTCHWPGAPPTPKMGARFDRTAPFRPRALAE
jgi:outer membrane protein LpxR